VLKPDELSDIERDLHDILDRLPIEKGAAVDAKGRRALAADCKGPSCTGRGRSAIRGAVLRPPMAATR